MKEQFSFTGRVIEGHHLGHTLGFPTANIVVTPGERVPAFGAPPAGGAPFAGLRPAGLPPDLRALRKFPAKILLPTLTNPPLLR